MLRIAAETTIEAKPAETPAVEAPAAEAPAAVETGAATDSKPAVPAKE